MADETKSPISEAVPPKANPLATPASAHVSTVKLKPAIRPGLKLPTKPAIPTAGLKLPPKAGATQTALKPGLKLPTKPAVRPVIRKPGATAQTPVVTPVAATVATPPPPPPQPMETLKTVTQNLKSLTSPIPQQAILRKTGIIAETEMTDAQKQAAKSKTARISLSDAMGVAPVKNEALPMKTIRIKRPVDIPGATGSTASAAPLSAATVTALPTNTQTSMPKVNTHASTKLSPQPNETTFTQRKTLKITRPTGGTVSPTGKFGVKKTTVAPVAKVAAEAAVADIADIPDMPPTAAAPLAIKSTDVIPDVPKGLAVTGLIVQIAACVAMAFLGWLLVENAQLAPYCGGLGM